MNNIIPLRLQSSIQSPFQYLEPSIAHPPNAKKTGNRFAPKSKNLASVIRGFKIGVTKYAQINGIDLAG